MLRTALLAIAVLALAGCAVTPPPDTARLPAGAFGGNDDNDIMAINTAEWAFASPARTRGNLINAIRAVMAVEYLAGELSSSPRWTFMSPRTKLDMLEARAEVRNALGIAPDAPSQVVANALLTLAARPTPATAAEVLVPPAFTLPPDETVARIANLPYLPVANVASLRAGAQEYPGSDSSCITCN